MRTKHFGNKYSNFFQAADTIRETFFGRAGNDKFQPYYHDTGADLSDRFIGGSGNDTLEALLFDFKNGSSLQDYKRLSFDGGRGYDTISSDIITSADGRLNLANIETSSRSIEHWDYDILIDGAGDEFILTTGKKNDTLEIVQNAGTVIDTGAVIKTRGGADKVYYHAADNVDSLMVITGNGNDHFEFSADWNVSVNLTVNTGKGADTVITNAFAGSFADRMTATIRTGIGADKIILDGMHTERLFAGGGNDKIYVLTGSFADAADIISTGKGRDKVFMELDTYSTNAIFDDFSAQHDVIVFSADEGTGSDPRNTDVTFSRAEWRNADEDRLFMNNSEGKLYFGDNVLADFGGATNLTQSNFSVETWDM